MSYCQGCADREARIAALETALAQERARGAVVREALEGELLIEEASERRGWLVCKRCERRGGVDLKPIKHLSDCPLADPSYAVAALLELAEAAGAVVRNGGYLAPEPAALFDLEAKWDRWEEVRSG